MTSDEEQSTYTQITESLGNHLKHISDHYEELTARTRELYREDLKKEFRAGREVTEDQLRFAKTTRRDLEMEIKLDKIREDPEKYYQEARKQALKDIAREDREEMLRPLRKLLDWILRRR